MPYPMDQEDKSIHDFDYALICDYFSSMERQGPGSPEATVTALGFVENLSEESKIADIGCGTGGQTMVLAEHTRGHIVGVDLFSDFIDRFNQNVRKRNLEDRVVGVVGSMENLPFQPEELDLIWSEGAIYNVGFERGMREWRAFLKTGGYIAVTEASWFTEERPDEIHRFWMEAYPEIDTIGNKICQMQKAGYVPVAAFVLPETCWIEHFYIPQASAQEQFLKKHAGNKTAEDLVRNERREAELYYKYKDFYGYVFYIGKKIDEACR